MKNVAKHSSIYDLLKLLEVKSYFDLTTYEKKKVNQYFKKDIGAWSFIPHPKVLEVINKNKHIKRYIVIIETLRANIYDSIRDFLSKNDVNINSYYTGGSADFICDAYLSEEAYNQFIESLKTKISQLTRGIARDQNN